MTLAVSVGGLALIGLPAVVKDLPAAASLAILVLGVFVSIVQALVFLLLSILYFSAAMEHAH